MPFASLGTLTAPHDPENSVYPFYYALYILSVSGFDILPVDVTGSSLPQCEGHATDLTLSKTPRGLENVHSCLITYSQSTYINLGQR